MSTKDTRLEKKPGRLAMSIRNWLGIGSPDDLQILAGSVSCAAGQTVTPTSALQLSAVWACARLISETISTLPLSIYERTSDGRRVARDHPLHFVIHDQPNPTCTAAVYWESVVAAMLLRGNAYSEKLMSGSRVIGLRFLSPSRLSITTDAAGNKQFRYTEKNGQRIIPAARIWHVPGFSIDGECGLSVISYGAQVFGAAQAAQSASASVFDRGLMQSSYFKMDRVLKKEQREEFRENLRGISGAIHAGDMPLLEGGMSAETLGISPDDAQLLQSRGFSVEECCRWFRVPPWMVGHSEKSTSWGTGIEQQMIGFLTFTLQPWLRRLEQSIALNLLSPAERIRYYPRFSVEGLLRADSAGRAAFYGAMVNNGVFTRDEVRALEDRSPMGGNAAVLTVQSAMTTLDSIGQQTDADTASAALRAWLSSEPSHDTQDIQHA